MPLTNAELTAALRLLSGGTDYQRGVLDVLRLLGLLAAEENAPSGDIARQVLAYLAAHAEQGTPLSFDWNSLEGGALGVDVLRAIEQAWAAQTGAPLPGGVAGREVQVVQSVIKARRNGFEYYLMQYDADARQYQPIGGKVEPSDADAAAAMRREIAEELLLEVPIEHDDCVLTVLRSGWEAVKVSPTYGVLTRYDFSFYHVGEIRFPVNQTAFTRWLRRAEIERGRGDDSRPVSLIYAEALGMDVLDGLEPSVQAI